MNQESNSASNALDNDVGTSENHVITSCSLRAAGPSLELTDSTGGNGCRKGKESTTNGVFDKSLVENQITIAKDPKELDESKECEMASQQSEGERESSGSSPRLDLTVHNALSIVDGMIKGDPTTDSDDSDGYEDRIMQFLQSQSRTKPLERSDKADHLDGQQENESILSNASNKWLIEDQTKIEDTEFEHELILEATGSEDEQIENGVTDSENEQIMAATDSDEKRRVGATDFEEEKVTRITDSEAEQVLGATDSEDSDVYEEKVMIYLLANAESGFFKRYADKRCGGIKDVSFQKRVSKNVKKDNSMNKEASVKSSKEINSRLVTPDANSNGVCLKGNSALIPLQNTETNGVNEGLFQCPLFDKLCISPKSLKRYKASHNVVPKSYICIECGRQFTQKTKYKYHMMIHSNIRPFACDLCDKRFVIKSKLSEHLETHYKTRKYQCTYCSAMFRLMSQRSIHINTKHRKVEFTCEHCLKSYYVKEPLVYHLNGYGGEGFYCKMCDVRCLCKTQFEQHIATHKQRLSFKCEFCPRAYSRPSPLKQHMSTAHCEITLKSNPDAVKCELCESHFRNKHEMRRHYRRSHKLRSKTQNIHTTP